MSSTRNNPRRNTAAASSSRSTAAPTASTSRSTAAPAVRSRSPDPTGAAAPAAGPHGPRIHGECLTVSGRLTRMTEMTPQDIAANIELFEQLIRPLGCSPMAPSHWVSLNNYPRIVEWRDEMRMDEDGLMIGDRTFKRLYHACKRGIARFHALSEEDQKLATDAGRKGYRPTRDDPLFLGPIRSPTYTIEHAFRFLTDKFWHRYLLPFGCFAYSKPTVTGTGWDAWRNHHVRSNAGGLMNPCAVTTADVLYLCNTDGYLDRFIYVVGVILWAKKIGNVNLLRHVSAPPRDSASEQFDRFMTLEKHIHLFGSIYMHRKVLEMNSHTITNNWKETIELINGFLRESYTRFGLVQDSLNRDLDNMIVEAPKAGGSLNNIHSFFPAARRLGAEPSRK